MARRTKYEQLTCIRIKPKPFLQGKDARVALSLKTRYQCFQALTKGVHNDQPTGIGRKNWLFAGADTGAETLARAMTIIETAKLNDLDPLAYLADILDRIHDHKINRLDELLPWNWAPLASAMGSQAA